MSQSFRTFPITLLIILGVITAFGPMTIDMYVPSLPNVQHHFGSSTSKVQLTLSFTMIGLAIGQFLFGPLSDAFGRKKVLLMILTIFLIASFAATLTDHLPLFLILRFVQGLTGGGAIVIAKASAGDKLHGNALAKFLAALMGVNGIITIIAPLIGGWSLKLGSWHVIFIVLTIVTFILIIGVLSQMPETAKDTHSKLNFSHIFSDFGQLLRKPKFVIPMLLQGLTYVMLFSYSSASPFITQKIYTLTPQQFSLMFAINGIGLIVVSQIVATLVEYIHRHTLLVYLSIIQIIGVILIVITLTYHLPISVLMISFFINICPVSSIGPLGFSMAMEERTGGSGNASSLLGLFQFILGGMISPLVGLAGQFNPMPYLIIISTTAAVFIILQFTYFKINKPYIK